MKGQAELHATQLQAQRKLSHKDDSASSYFIEGYELPQQEQLIRDKLLIHIPLIKSKNYRESLLTIVASIAQLDKFSLNLEGKVDTMLQAQQNHFVDSYKGHVNKIKTQFDKMSKHIQELQEKIRYYENQGKMSALVKKVFNLEQESAKLYKNMAERDKRIKDLEVTVKVQEDQLKRMKEAIKLNAREKSQIIWKEQLSKAQSNQTPVKLHQMTVFATQLEKKGSFTHSHHDSFIEQRGITYKSLLGNELSSLKSMTCEIQQKTHESKLTSKNKLGSLIQERLSKQNARLRSKNKQLMSFQTKVINSQNELQDFFILCVQELKKEIRIRKKMDYCSLQDFKKQDKLLLLIKVLSNNEILTYLHERLFKKTEKAKSHQSLEEIQPKINISSNQQHKKLPKINFNLSYQNKI